MGTVHQIRDARYKKERDKVTLFFSDDLTHVQILSMVDDHVYLDEKYTNKIPMEEYEAMISCFKERHKDLICVDF